MWDTIVWIFDNLLLLTGAWLCCVIGFAVVVLSWLSSGGMTRLFESVFGK